jgi:hypothetical protein
MGAYEDGYQAGSIYGAIGACLADSSQQAEYDRGFADAQAGRPAAPQAPLDWWQPNPAIQPYWSSDPNAEPPPRMDPWSGVPGSGVPEPPEWPEYHEPRQPYEPEPMPEIEID